MNSSAPSAQSSSASLRGNAFPLWVVILNWNLPDDTLACVQSVRDAARQLCGDPRSTDVQILIVDNGSQDDSVDRFRAAFQADADGAAVEVLATGANLGFAGGMNAGIQVALARGAQSVLLLNNDTESDAHMLAHLAAALEVEPGVGLVGPVIYYADLPQRIWRAADNEHAWLPIPRRVPDDVVARQTAAFAVDYITACAMLVRAEVFARIGLLDDAYFMYYEDADFCRRARAAGFGIRCAPQAKLWHKVSASANREKAAIRYARAWARTRFYRTYPHGKMPWLVHIYLWAKTVVISAGDVLRGDLHLVRPLWHGTLDGYRPGASPKHAAYYGREPRA
jgi:hypothetical protein